MSWWISIEFRFVCLFQSVQYFYWQQFFQIHINKMQTTFVFPFFSSSVFGKYCQIVMLKAQNKYAHIWAGQIHNCLTINERPWSLQCFSMNLEQVVAWLMIYPKYNILKWCCTLIKRALIALTLLSSVPFCVRYIGYTPRTKF